MANEIIDKNTPFFTDIATLLRNARSKAYRAVNSIMVETYWKVGERIVKEEQNGKSRAEYGKKLITSNAQTTGVSRWKANSKPTFSRIGKRSLEGTEIPPAAGRMVLH